MALKPRYQIPSVRQILDIPANGLSVVSTFSGAGGSCLGYRWAGYSVVWASEFVEAARDTYAANFPNALIDDRDIREVTAADITKATGLAKGEIDILEGSPPCASFSLAGKRQMDWGEVKAYSDTRQRTDDLFDEYIRLVKELQPRVFVAENVPGLVIGKAVGYFKRIVKALGAAGYRVAVRELNAEWLGVPQRRKRLFIIGVRNDLKLEPVFPKPLPYRYMLRDVLPHDVLEIQSAYGYTATLKGLSGHEWKGVDRCAETISASAPKRVRVSDKSIRPLKINELKAICGFPDDFELTGTYAQQYERLGRAVCPPVAKAVGVALREGVL